MTVQRQFSADDVISGLTGFQAATVEHVTRRFYGPDHTRRFLVADETGLGKTLVARGVIARTIEHLEADSDVDRIDIVYVCSNADIAHQNISKLDVTGDPYLRFASRLTLLAKHGRDFSVGGSVFTKRVNLVSFTPGTSFDKGWRTGKAEERAMLYLLLRQPLALSGVRDTATRRILQGGVATLEGFDRSIRALDDEIGEDLDPAVAAAFVTAFDNSPLREEMERLIGEMGRRRSVPSSLQPAVRNLTGNLRSMLARESIQTLEPDLVILDEFQRFRHLLDPSSEAGELAHNLFDFGKARVLLLSATPYKPFTYAEEALAGDDHHANFMETIRFLAAGSSEDPEAIAHELRSYRTAVTTGASATAATQAVRSRLLRVMSRTERPRTHGEGMLREIRESADDLHVADLKGFVALRRVAHLLNSHMSIEYWKGAPYFANFMDGYKIRDDIRDGLEDPELAGELQRRLSETQRLTRRQVRRFEPIDFGNARLRRLAAETVEQGWWKLLWLPPSMPYLETAGPYAEPFAASMTKRLIFSSWAATPTAVSALLSYEADRQIAMGSRLTENTAEARRTIGNRLQLRLERDRPQSMSALALFWPMPGLARLADPLAHRYETGPGLTAAELQGRVATAVGSKIPNRPTTRASTADSAYWILAMSWKGTPVAKLGLSGAVAPFSRQDLSEGDDAQEDEGSALAQHVQAAIAATIGDLPEVVPEDLAETVADLAAHSPGNIAWRALGRLKAGGWKVTDEGQWIAAAALANGFRTLFGRPDTTLLLDKVMPQADIYWRAVLAYCAAGNLQSVMDEYLFHLANAEGVRVLTDDSLLKLARTAASAIALRPADYDAFDPDHPDTPMGFSARFALRYGGRKQDPDNARPGQVRQAFNSPFWPLVLATTSVGQEGIDFHWWCHAIMHWNTPPNPVDFEQREGRVDRFDGLAVRRNIAARHGNAVLASGATSPWAAAYEAAMDEFDRLGEFSPHWVYPGTAHIERHVSPFPLSVDEGRLARIKQDVALYRLTFGQPRQEDLLELLRERNVHESDTEIDAMRVDLSAPRDMVAPPTD